MSYFARPAHSCNAVEELLRDVDHRFDKFYGGSPIEKDKLIRLHESTLGKEELMAFISCYIKGNITMGSVNDRYEKQCSEKFDSKYCISCNSGSSANLLAISALVQTGRLKKGDKIIVPALSWSTTVFPLSQYGLIPVFVDQNDIDFNINVSLIKDCVLKDPKIKGIMIIHTYGVPADIETIINIAEDCSLIVVEDTCESMGAEVKGRKVGSFGNIGTFSSYYSHHICTLEGGLAITNEEEIYSSMQSVRSHGWIRDSKNKDEIAISNNLPDPDFLFLNQGYNLRLSEPQSAIGIEQINKLDAFILERNKNAELYSNLLKDRLGGLITIPQVKDGNTPSWFGMPVRFNELNKDKIKQLRVILREKGIESRPFLCGNFAKQPVMKGIKHEIFRELRVADDLTDKALALPCHQNMNDDVIERVTNSLSKAYKEIV